MAQSNFTEATQPSSTEETLVGKKKREENPKPPIKKPKTPEQQQQEDKQRLEDFEEAYQEANPLAKETMDRINATLPPVEPGGWRTSEKDLRDGFIGSFMKAIKLRRKLKEEEEKDTNGPSL